MIAFFKHILFILFFLIAQNTSFAQNNYVEMPIVVAIPSVALIDFSGSEKKVIFKSGNGAEQIITPSSFDKTWINYSSIVDDKSTNNISVQLSTENLNSSIKIMLEIGEDQGEGAGKVGKSVGQIALTPYPQEIITGIGSCYTGKGAEKGHKLVYFWEWKSPYDKISGSFENIEIAVIYTLTNNK